MNKKWIMLLFLPFLFIGCTYAGEKPLDSYLKNPMDPATWIKDPHFENYKAKRDALESRYLAGKITYADYLDQRQALDDTYAREVAERNAKISGDE